MRITYVNGIFAKSKLIFTEYHIPRSLLRESSHTNESRNDRAVVRSGGTRASLSFLIGLLKLINSRAGARGQSGSH